MCDAQCINKKNIQVLKAIKSNERKKKKSLELTKIYESIVVYEDVVLRT